MQTNDQGERKDVEGKDRTFAEDGTDLTLIRWMLDMAPVERLKTSQRYAQALRRVADVGKSS